MHALVVRRPRVAALVVLVAAGMLVSSLGAVAHAGDVTRKERLFRLTNEARVHHDRARVALADRLSHYAKRHSKAMAARGYLFHSDTSTLQRVLAPYHWSIGGENVGVGDSVTGLQDAFMASKPHRRNILRTAFDHTAIGIVRERGALWVTVIFYG
jgi:uncharacterized protein YkwD